jgi:hypothetical protein
VATRYDLSLAATFELKRKADGKTVYRSAVRRVSSYNVRDEPFATLVAERDAERRAAREVGRQIRTQLALPREGAAAVRPGGGLPAFTVLAAGARPSSLGRAGLCRHKRRKSAAQSSSSSSGSTAGSCRDSRGRSGCGRGPRGRAAG